jgi:dipeptidase D
VYVEDGWVKANGTTLGADNGAGMAIAMAILQSKTLNAGPIEALFTVDEETTMSGAGGLKPGELQSEIYINLDAEIEGQFIISSAGGAAAGVQAAYREVPLPAGMAAYRFSVQGLAGGHSGLDIYLGRGHAGKLMVRWLREAAAKYGLRVAEMASGTAGNAIPREATALVCVPQAQADAFLAGVSDYEATIKAELAAVEPKLSAGAVPADLPALVMDEADQRRLLAALYATPQGVIRMSAAAPGLVETSTNMGIVRAQAGTLEVTNYMRSSVDSALDDLVGLIASVWEAAGVSVTVSGRYVGWAPNPNSPILAIMMEVYEEEFGYPPEVTGVHAGTECGTIVVKYPHLDTVAIGPTIEDVHSPAEKMDVASVQKVMDLLKATLERTPEK